MCVRVCVCIPAIAGIFDPFVLQHSLNTGTFPCVLEGIFLKRLKATLNKSAKLPGDNNYSKMCFGLSLKASAFT